MKSKGFTLIELLAVIVILAVIALIATPAVLNIIEDSKRSSAEDSARIIAKEAEIYYMSEGTLQGNEVGDIDLTKDTLEYKGEKPSKGYVTFNENGDAYLKMYMNGYCVESDYDNTVTSEKTNSDECTMGAITIPLNLNGGTLDVTELTFDEGAPLGALPIPTKYGYEFAGWFTEGSVRVDENTLARANLTLTAKWVGSSLTVILDNNRPYVNGEAIYFNPVTNEACTESQYNATTNSVNGFRGTSTNGCMLWRAFLDSNDATTVKLLLDHNTSEAEISLEVAKTEIANAKDNNLYGWHADVRSTVRMISAEEVVEIAPYKGSGTWSPAYSYMWYYFHYGKTNSYQGPAGTNKYAWLFDNTYHCASYGCNVDQGKQGDSEGYWAPSNDYGWTVYHSGEFIIRTIGSVRPVIEVPKDVVLPKTIVTYGETYGEMPIPTKEGYEFTGWYTTGGTKVTEDSIVEIIEDTTLYAQWQPSQYTVTFKAGGEVVSTKTVTYDSTYGTLPSNVVKEGYLFKGWKMDDYTPITSESLVTIASNHDIEAVLVEKTYLDELYFNPVTNEACSDYTTSNSTEGYVGKNGTGCMKWYAYKEDGDNYLMILDHDSTSGSLIWADAQTEIADVKNNNKYGWHADVYPTARMISAEEVHEIAPRIDETWTLSGTIYYFHNGTAITYSTAIAGSNKYAWLFDNTFTCYENGCNVAQNYGFGYWTSSVRDDGKVWTVNCSGCLVDNPSDNNRMVRPVISVPKSKFTN